MNIVVVDDFYKDPFKVRDLALNSVYKDVTRLNYPGLQSIKDYSSKDMTVEFTKILSRPLEIDPTKLTFGRFRIMLKETRSRLKVHLDGGAHWTGVLYLNLPKQCEGGTGFYRHKATGLNGRASNKEIKDHGFESWTEMENAMIEKDTLDSNSWEQTDLVAMKFNRLVLFKGNELFHCHTHSFGKNKQDGRLTQNFFFNEVSNEKI